MDAVYQAMPPTPQYCWPLICERAGTEVWLKHENHTPLGAFKTRTALAYLRWLYADEMRPPKIVVTATRGNFGQAVAFAAKRFEMEAVLFVPHGNSASKNRAMRALGARLVEHGDDFEEARQEAVRWATAEQHHYIPSFHEELIAGAATYSTELFDEVKDIEVMYVPIGMGSGLLGACAAKEADELETEIVGVCSEQARGIYESFTRREVVGSPATTRIADGMAVPMPNPDALQLMLEHVSRIVMVSDDEVAGAMRAIFDDTHNVAEGGGAAGLAAILKEKDRLHGKRVATVISGGNVDRELFAQVLRG